MAGLGLGWLLYFMIKFINRFRGNLKKALIAIALAMTVLVIVVNINAIYDILWGIFSAEDLAEGRSNLYKNAIEVGFTSPIIGLGPGAHIFQEGQYWDSHQTFLTVLIQSGLIGLALLISLFYKMSKNILKVPSLLAGFIPILIYAMGGDVMRRLPIWLLLLLIHYYIISQVNDKIENEKFE
jgi:O-antigen ligase